MVTNFNLKAQCEKEKEVLLGNCQTQCLYIAVTQSQLGCHSYLISEILLTGSMTMRSKLKPAANLARCRSPCNAVHLLQRCTSGL